MTDVALVHDYLTQRRGAERVVLALAEIFPDAPIHTALFDPEHTFDQFAMLDVRPLPLNRIRWLRPRHRYALPVLAPSFSAAKVDAEVTVVSSSGWAHGIRTEGAKVVFCHSPARWLYQRSRYLGPDPAAAQRLATAALGPPLRRWDRRAAQSADRYLANSTTKAAEIAHTYGITAEVVHPPVAFDAAGSRQPVPGIEPGYLLCVAAALPYKNVDAVVEAFRRLSRQRLVVVSGLAGSNLPKNVRLVTDASEDELRWLYANSVGLVSASYEDFGLTPLEAAAHGVPSAVLRFGGHLDSVIDGRTGVFFDTPHPDDIRQAVTRLLRRRWHRDDLTARLEAFSPDRFQRKIQEVVQSVR